MSEGTRFVVRRLNWRKAGDGWVRLPGETAVMSFPTFAEAEADRHAREADVRSRVGNPFRCGPSFVYLTTFPEPIFLDWLRDAGVEPTQPGQRKPVNWAGWWEQARTHLTPDQVGRVWQGLDKVRFFDVVERPAARTAYAVVRVLWEYNDNWMEPGQEGGECVRAFRDRRNAEAYRALLEEQARAEHDPGGPEEETGGHEQFEVDRWRYGPFDDRPDADRYTVVRGREAVFYEVVEVELGDAAEGGS